MEHEYHTSRRRQPRRAWAPIVGVGVLLAAVLGGILLAFRGDGPAEIGGPLPSRAAPATTVAATTTPPTTGPVVVTAPPVIVPPAPGAGGTPPDEPLDNPREALRVLADDTDATIVSDVVAMGSGRYAMLAQGDDAELYRWSRSAWERETVLDTPAAVRGIDVADVTGDGVDDFIVSLVGLTNQGGVFSRATFSFGLLPFNLPSGQEDWVDDLHVSVGRLLSDVPVNGMRTQVEWTWTGRQFAVLG